MQHHNQHQAAAITQQITKACRRGRVDAVVQSTDKNFMVPVGGAVIAAPASGPLDVVATVNTLFPGRAAMAPLLDVLITLLHWGADGWRGVLQARETLHTYARDRMTDLAQELGARWVVCWTSAACCALNEHVGMQCTAIYHV